VKIQLLKPETQIIADSFLKAKQIPLDIISLSEKGPELRPNKYIFNFSNKSNTRAN